MLKQLMQNSSEKLPQTLRPLVLFCLPEQRPMSADLAILDLPPLFSRPDYAVSW